MPKKSAGILLFRLKPELQFFIVHPGGPFYVKKDKAVWSIPKGEFDDVEDPLAAAIREFNEETGTLPAGQFLKLSPVTQSSGKMVYAWALKFDLDSNLIHSNNFTLEWPPKSGIFKEFPEIDRGQWCSEAEARVKLIVAQTAFIDELINIIARINPL